MVFTPLAVRLVVAALVMTDWPLTRRRSVELVRLNALSGRAGVAIVLLTTKVPLLKVMLALPPPLRIELAITVPLLMFKIPSAKELVGVAVTFVPTSTG